MSAGSFKIQNPNPTTPFLAKGGRGGFHKTCNLQVETCNFNLAGFTLLELTISITIIGVIVLMVGSAMRLGFRSVDSGEKKMESLERFRASLAIIDSQVQSEIPLTYMENGDLRFYFKGQKEFLQFSTNYSLWDRQMGYVLVKYKVVSEDGKKKSLYVSENIIGIKDKRKTKLLDDFDDIYFEYFYKDLTDEKKVEWIKEWKYNVYPPEKVRLNLVNGTKIFSFIIPVRVMAIGF